MSARPAEDGIGDDKDVDGNSGQRNGIHQRKLARQCERTGRRAETGRTSEDGDEVLVTVLSRDVEPMVAGFPAYPAVRGSAAPSLPRC